MLLHVWLTVPYRPNTLDNAFEYHTQLVAGSDTSLDTDQYILDAIVGPGGIGADAFMAHLLDDLQRDGISDRYFAALLEALRMIALRSPLLPYFVKHRCLTVAEDKIKERCVPGGDQRRLVVYEHALALV